MASQGNEQAVEQCAEADEAGASAGASQLSALFIRATESRLGMGMRMGRGANIIGVTTLASIGTGIVAAVVLMLWSAPSGQIVLILTNGGALVNFLLAALMASLPVSVPAGLGGGILAANVAKKDTRPSSVYEWGAWGCVRGFALGSFVSFGYFIVLNGWHEIVLPMVGVGGVVGAVTGLLVGMRVSRMLEGKSANHVSV